MAKQKWKAGNMVYPLPAIWLNAKIPLKYWEQQVLNIYKGVYTHTIQYYIAYIHYAQLNNRKLRSKHYAQTIFF